MLEKHKEILPELSLYLSLSLNVYVCVCLCVCVCIKEREGMCLSVSLNNKDSVGKKVSLSVLDRKKE